MPGRYAANTEVSSDRSRSEIERTLRRYGASAFGYAWEGQSAQIAFRLADRQIRFTLPLPDQRSREFTLTPTGRERSRSSAEEAYEQAVRQRWRALALVIKAKLEAVEAEISTVEREFLDAIMLPDGRTVGDWLGPQLAAVYTSNSMPALMPGTSDA